VESDLSHPDEVGPRRACEVETPPPVRDGIVVAEVVAAVRDGLEQHPAADAECFDESVGELARHDEHSVVDSKPRSLCSDVLQQVDQHGAALAERRVDEGGQSQPLPQHGLEPAQSLAQPFPRRCRRCRRLPGAGVGELGVGLELLGRWWLAVRELQTGMELRQESRAGGALLAQRAELADGPAWLHAHHVQKHGAKPRNGAPAALVEVRLEPRRVGSNCCLVALEEIAGEGSIATRRDLSEEEADGRDVAVVHLVVWVVCG